VFFAKPENEKTGEGKSQSDTLETLHRLYPIFKEEVYRRRASMAQIARLGVFFNVAFSLMIALFSEKLPREMGFRYSSVVGVLLLALLLIYQIFQEKSRHEKAKLQLITLERSFGFFEAGKHLPNETLYPANWQDRPKIDPGLVVMCLSIAGTAAVLIFTIFSL